MIKKVRKPGRTKNILVYFIFGLICLVFVFFGVTPDQFGLSSGGPAAMVNNRAISIARYQDAFNNAQNQYQRQLQGMPAARRQSFLSGLGQQVLESLINEELLAQTANQAGLYTSDEEIKKAIVDIPAFQDDGRFSRERYDGFLEMRGMTAQELEGEFRRGLAATKLRDIFQKSVTLPESVENFVFQVTSSKANLVFADVSGDRLARGVKVTAAKAQSFANDEANKEELDKHYKLNISEYSTPEQVRARHILIKIDEDTTDQQAKTKIENIAKEANKENFPALALKHSEDAGSKAKGGDLGFFGKGRMVPEFEESAFTLAVGSISKPIKTNFGYHLIFVEDKKEASSKTFDEVKTTVAMSYLRKEEAKALQAKLKEALEAGNSAGIRSWMKAQKITPVETGEFSLAAEQIPKLGEAGSFLTALKTVKVGEYAKNLVPSLGREFVIQLKEFKKGEAPKTPGLMSIMGSRSSRDVLSKYMEEIKENSKIQRNSQLFVR